MTFDEVLIALIAVSAALGGLLVLTLCAFQVQMYKLGLRVQIIEEQRRQKKKKLSESSEPLEVS
jgi:hypothetical protein